MEELECLSPSEAFDRLLSGNQRFVEERQRAVERSGAERRAEIASGQRPFAAVLTCADSQVSPSMVFDAALGELFVCRNAGNVLDELTVGSLEYAVAHTGCPLVVVMGHTNCGAANAAVAWARAPEESETHNIDDVMRRLAPAVTATRDTMPDDVTWADAVAEKNVAIMCRQLVQRSPLLDAAMTAGRVAVAGLHYHLDNGRVEVIVAPEFAPTA